MLNPGVPSLIVCHSKGWYSVVPFSTDLLYYINFCCEIQLDSHCLQLSQSLTLRKGGTAGTVWWIWVTVGYSGGDFVSIRRRNISKVSQERLVMGFEFDHKVCHSYPFQFSCGVSDCSPAFGEIAWFLYPQSFPMPSFAGKTIGLKAL